MQLTVTLLMFIFNNPFLSCFRFWSFPQTWVNTTLEKSIQYSSMADVQFVQDFQTPIQKPWVYTLYQQDMSKRLKNGCLQILQGSPQKCSSNPQYAQIHYFLISTMAWMVQWVSLTPLIHTGVFRNLLEGVDLLTLCPPGYSTRLNWKLTWGRGRMRQQVWFMQCSIIIGGIGCSDWTRETRLVKYNSSILIVF